jgi:hypothetical protein
MNTSSALLRQLSSIFGLHFQYVRIVGARAGETQKYRHNNRPVLAVNGRTMYSYEADPSKKKKVKDNRGICKP